MTANRLDSQAGPALEHNDHATAWVLYRKATFVAEFAVVFGFGHRQHSEVGGNQQPLHPGRR